MFNEVTLFLVPQQGVRFDPELPQTIRLEFAKSNTKVSKPKQPAAASATAHPTLVHPLTGRKYSLFSLNVPGALLSTPRSDREKPNTAPSRVVPLSGGPPWTAPRILRLDFQPRVLRPLSPSSLTHPACAPSARTPSTFVRAGKSSASDIGTRVLNPLSYTLIEKV